MIQFSKNSLLLLIGVFLLLLKQRVDGFYIPGVNPQSFSEGDSVKLKVNKMTSTKTQLPLNYYNFPFCEPEKGPEMVNENLGEFLAGDRIQSSPYVLFMKKDMYCEHLCKSYLGRPEQKGMNPNKVVKAIRKNYHNNWIVDNLNSASKVENDNLITTKYWQGFPVGFIMEETKMAYIHNHVNIEIVYHPVETEVDKFRIVRFTVEPFSIAHEANFAAVLEDDFDDQRDSYLPAVAEIKNPIRSCDPSVTHSNPQKDHTDYDMIVQHKPQPASGDVLFTYDVIWKIDPNLQWGSRWDIYLTGIEKATVHWKSIIFSLVVVIVLSCMMAAVLVRNLRRERDLTCYNEIAADEEKADEVEDFDWKLIHADVFLPPVSNPILLAVACGSGAQIFCMAFLIIIFSSLGFLSPAQRGALVTTELILFALFGSVAGYVTAKLCKTFRVISWQRAALLAALCFPGLVFAMFFISNVIAWTYESTNKVSATTMIVLAILWFGIATPLVFVGAYFGYKQDAIEFPVNTSNIPRQIPDQPWFISLPCTMVVGGILPFGGCFVELYYIWCSIWMEYYYYVFGFLLLVFIILIINAVEITILFSYLQFRYQNYKWWWRSFCNAGSVSIYVFLYSIGFAAKLEADAAMTYILYLGYMGLVSFSLFLMLGFLGVVCSLWFHITIFRWFQ